ncbi:NAD(P)-dependent oxidoreductase [Iodidimonas gelatinilytica]|nr:NAD(P)-dependent oxidoreductase [Iodidimonas gelatinilytica]
MTASRPNRPSSPSRAEKIDAAFRDLHPALTSGAAVTEASRCLYCYDAPCIRACPTGIDIPTFIHQIRSGNLEGSAQTILSENIMGGTCARACPTEVLCEEACVLNKGEDKPIQIGDLQRHAVDHLIEQTHAGAPHPFQRAAATGRSIAVVGAGPAGLAFAHRAAMLGHDITIYESRLKPGGLNEYGLAEYKMVDDFAQREVAFLLGIGGIKIRYGRALGEDIQLEALRQAYDVVFIGIGLGGAARLAIAGEELEGVEDALSFIETLRQTKPKSKVSVGRTVVVIGGGNTAIDAAIQAKKLGAESVTLVYRRGEDAMSATGFERNLARLNDVQIRLWSRPSAIEGNDRVESIVFEKTTLNGGRLQGTGEVYRLPADHVLKAIGQKLRPMGLDGLAAENGKIQIGPDYRTSLDGVYAGGDCVSTGEDLTVQAVEDGKRAAEAVHQALAAQSVERV